jgi:hypothetical protein
MIESITQHSKFEKKPNKYMGRLQNNPSIGSVHSKSTHVCPLAWGNNKISHYEIIFLAINMYLVNSELNY